MGKLANKITKKLLIVGIGFFVLAIGNSVFLHFASGRMDDFGPYKIILSVITQTYLLPILIGSVILVELIPKEKVKQMTEKLMVRN